MKKLQSNCSFFLHLMLSSKLEHEIQKNEPYRTRSSFWFAEREGFEPPEPLSSTVFKTAAIDHSAISPLLCRANLVRRMRLELTRSCDHYPLKVACIPISPPALRRNVLVALNSLCELGRPQFLLLTRTHEVLVSL